MRLFHFTSRNAATAILSGGEILMARRKIQPWYDVGAPVVWLTDHDGADRNFDTIATGLLLSKPGRPNRSTCEVRFTVEIPESEAFRFVDQEAHARARGGDLAWPRHPEWWWFTPSQIPAARWESVDLCEAGSEGLWLPLLALAPEPEG